MKFLMIACLLISGCFNELYVVGRITSIGVCDQNGVCYVEYQVISPSTSCPFNNGDESRSVYPNSTVRYPAINKLVCVRDSNNQGDIDGSK